MFVVSEPHFAQSNWYEEIVAGLKAAARKKRETLEFTETPAAVRGAVAFVIGSSYAWLSATTAALSSHEVHPIVLSNRSSRAFVGRYSSVSADVSLSMADVCARLTQNGYTRPALYGVNRASLSDIGRAEAFATLYGTAPVFYNDGSLTACFESFLPVFEREHFDAVICANDYAAVSLKTHLSKTDHSLPPLVSFSNTLLSQYTAPTVTSVALNYRAFGAAAFAIADCVAKNPALTGLHATVEWEIFSRQTLTLPAGVNTPPLPAREEPNRFYHDEELQEMLGIEKLLSHLDDTDRHILQLALVGTTSAAIAERCFLSDNALKYRFKKMEELCGVSSKSVLITRLKTYAITL